MKNIMIKSRAGMTWMLLTMILLLSFTQAGAHEVRPAYLQIREDSAHRVHITWKQPARGEMTIKLQPHISAGWLDETPASVFVDPSYFIEQWNADARLKVLDGQEIWIEGLENTITDVLVDISLADGSQIQQVVKPSQPRMLISAKKSNTVPAASYIRLGIVHILTGFDHLLFVLGLVLLVKRKLLLLKTITAFTLAHSITLAGSSMGWMRMDASLAETLIAFSILFLAVELVQSHKGRSGIMAKFPWVVAFGFGLLHGFGFAGALADIGLPQNQAALALLFFNIGVEAGQLFFVVLVLLFQRLLQQTSPLLYSPRWSAFIAPYIIGGCSAYWFMERLFNNF